MWFWRTFDSIQYVKLIFKCSKSTSKKYDFKKSNTHFSSPWVLDYTCKKVEWSVEPDYQKYPSFMAMSGCQNKRSILKMIKLNWTKINEIETLKTSIHLHWLIFWDFSLHDRVPHTYRLTSYMILYRVFSFSKILWAANVYSPAEKALYE